MGSICQIDNEWWSQKDYCVYDRTLLHLYLYILLVVLKVTNKFVILMHTSRFISTIVIKIKNKPRKTKEAVWEDVGSFVIFWECMNLSSKSTSPIVITTTFSKENPGCLNTTSCGGNTRDSQRFNPLAPRGDGEVTSPCNILKLSSKQVMRINLSYKSCFSYSNTIFS